MWKIASGWISRPGDIISNTQQTGCRPNSARSKSAWQVLSFFSFKKQKLISESFNQISRFIQFLFFSVCCLITGIYWLYACCQYNFQVFIRIIEFCGPCVQVHVWPPYSVKLHKSGVWLKLQYIVKLNCKKWSDTGVTSWVYMHRGGLFTVNNIQSILLLHTSPVAFYVW